MNRLFEGAGLLLIMFYIYAFVSYFVNIYQLFTCNFDAPWKDEIIHGLGLIPGLSTITVWL